MQDAVLVETWTTHWTRNVEHTKLEIRLPVVVVVGFRRRCLSSLILLINRAAMGRARFMVSPWFILFFSFCVTRPKPPLGQMSNHATYHVYSLKAVGTLIHGKCYGYCFL